MCILCRAGENPNFFFLGLSAQRALSKMVSPLGIQPNGSFFVNSDFLSLREEESYGELIMPVQKKAPEEVGERPKKSEKLNSKLRINYSELREVYSRNRFFLSRQAFLMS